MKKKNVNSDFEKLKKFSLKNIVRAGETAHVSQRDCLRKLYKKVNYSKNIEEIFLFIEEVYDEAPYEKSLVKNWPNQKYFIQWLDRELKVYLLDLTNGTDFAGHYTGYPYSGGDMGSEWEEQEIEKELTYR